MNSMRIINPGILTTIQDIGREGYQQYGVPVAGAMDKSSMKLANILVGNDRNEAVLEITMMGPTIKFNSNLTIAITGAKCSPTINDKEVEMYRTIYIAKGDILKFSTTKDGFRVYLAVSGGFKLSETMGSKSTYLRGKIGGLEGRKVKAGDILEANGDECLKYLGIRKIPENLIPKYKNEVAVRVILGPEEDYFTERGIETFLNSDYILTNQSDRMGYRLKGEKIEHKDGADIISSGITLGAIQVPGHGEPIIMMADRQTTGGYAKIANVISVDISYLAQLKPGDRVKFKKVSIEEAHNLIKEEEKALEELIEDFNKRSVEKVGKVRDFVINVKNSHYNVMVQEIK